VISVAEIVSDPELAQPFLVRRSTGEFVQGGWQDTLSSVSLWGVITVADPETLDQMPEADRPTGAMAFYSAQAIFETRVATPTYGARGYGTGSYGGVQGVSDVILWRGQPFRILKVWPYADYGYFKAVGVRMSGA
jgi:hypothetical protein